ncbi:unnamed protein product [Lampetra planeri]
MVKTKARITGEFNRMRAMMDEDEKTALDRVDVKGRELLSQIEENIAHYKHEINELQAAATRLRTLQEERDSLTFLQALAVMMLCDDVVWDAAYDDAMCDEAVCDDELRVMMML